MSLAWTTVVLVILLLPGFLFFFGLYAPERLSRDLLQDSALSRLAGVVFISFVVHGAAFVFVNEAACDVLSAIPCISLRYVFAILQFAGSEKYDLGKLANVIARSGNWILLYVLMTTGVGYLAGTFVGSRILRGNFKSLTKHGWVYDLIAANQPNVFIHAYVLTNIQHEGRILMYRGFVKDFFATPDGRIAYLVLKDCIRYYLKLEKKAPTTSHQDDWLPIGASHGVELMPSRQWSYLIIEGEDIANVVFEAYRPLLSPIGEEELKKALEAIAELNAELTEKITAAKPKKKSQH